MDEKLEKELKRLKKQKEKARQAEDRSEEASLCNITGELLAQHRLFEEAIQQHNAELNLSELLRDHIAVGVAHRKIGECLCELQDFKQALFHQQKHLEISRRFQNIVEEQRALATIGRTLFQSACSSSDFEKAKTAFTDSLSICGKLVGIVKEKELLEMKARLFLNLGLVYNLLENKKKGMKYIYGALKVAGSVDLKDTEYRCHFSLGEIHLAENRLNEALRSFEHARKVAQHQKLAFEEADTLVQMAQVLLQLGDFNGAKNILKKCFKTMKHGDMIDKLRSSLAKSIKGTRLLETLENHRGTDRETLMKTYEDLGDLYASVKCFSKAVNYYEKQLHLSEVLGKTSDEKAVICFSVAQSYSDYKQYNKAKEYFQKELALRKDDPKEQCDAWCNITLMSKLAGDSREEVEKAYNNALEMCESLTTEQQELLLCEVKRKLDPIIADPNNHNSKEQCESMEQSQFDEFDNDEAEQLIQEEMELSDSDDDEQNDEMEKSSTVRLKSNSKSVNKRNEKGETVLHVAAINGNYSAAKSSIEKGVSVHERDYCGWQPLHEACNHGNLSIVELLLDRGANINDPGGPHCGGMTPLHDAVQNAHVDVVKLLIARGASVNLKNKDGHTPLDLVMQSIDDDDDNDDDDELDPDVGEIREELAGILRNAKNSGKRQPVTSGEISRKRKIAMELDSDEESTPKHSSTEHRAKVPKVSKHVDSGPLFEDDSEPVDDQCFHEFSDFGTSSFSTEPAQRNTNNRKIPSSEEHNGTSCSFSKNNTSSPKSFATNAVSRTNDPLPMKNGKSITYVNPVTGNTQEDCEISESQPALIPENEYIATDDWLINDLPKPTGKRNSASSRNISTFSSTPSSSRMRITSNASPPGTQSTQVVGISKGRRTTPNGGKNRLRQSHLTLVSGRSSLCSSPNEAEPATTASSSGVATMAEAPMRLRVQVEDKKFLIPCPSIPGERKTVQWLAEQAVFRYHSATGLKPILSLCTTEGASLSTDDIITEVLSNNELVNGIVESWDLPPLAERYKTACLMVNTETEKKILDVFERCSHIVNVEFSKLSLTPGKVLPLFRSLQCHDELVKLVLAGNKIGDVGLQHLISSLPCLTNLSILTLACNGITPTGLRNLASSLSQDHKVSKAWSNLKELDISFNTITDVASSSLAFILRSCPNLLKLDIEHCSLTQTSFLQKNTLVEALQDLKRLQDLNVSHNLIQSVSIPFLLRACPVEILNLSSTVSGHDPAFASVLAEYLKMESCSIQHLVCRCCYLDDTDALVLARNLTVSTSCSKLDLGENNISDEGVAKLIKSVQHNPNVKELVLSGNRQITNESWSKFFTSPLALTSLDLSHSGLRSPLPECLFKPSAFPRHLMFLDLSFNSLHSQDIQRLVSLWELKWQGRLTRVRRSRSFVVLEAN